MWSVLTLWTFVFLSERSFKSCLLSWFFFWHLLWLSVMQLRHYLFIGTLNPMLNHLSAGDPGLGIHTHTVLSSCPAIYVQVNRCVSAVCVDIDVPTGCIMCASWAWTLSTVFLFLLTVSRYTNAFAFTQLCGILCAPWNGLIMDRHKRKQREPGQHTFPHFLSQYSVYMWKHVILWNALSCLKRPLIKLKFWNKLLLSAGHV